MQIHPTVYANPSLLLLILNRQVNAHPPRAQPDPLLFRHAHTRIISLEQR